MPGNLFEMTEIEPNEKPAEAITYTPSKAEPKKQPLRLEHHAPHPRQEEIIESENLPSDAKR